MVRVFFATNRSVGGKQDSPQFGRGFNADGPSALRFGWADVPEDLLPTLRPTEQRDAAGNRQLIDVTDGDPRRIRITVAPERLKGRGRQKLGSQEVFSIVHHKMEKHARDTVVFVHGYANSFRSALMHAALLKTTYGLPMNMVLFSWPSDGTMIPFMSYYRDRADAKSSGEAIARCFLKLREFLIGLGASQHCQQRLHLMAHSMGNYAVRHGVQGIRAELGDELPRIFDNILLFAADEDEDAFEHDHKLRVLPTIGRLVHVYHRRDDRALLVSDLTKANPDRLGSDGPRLTDDLPRKVIVVDARDCSDPEGKDSWRHDSHRYSPEMIDDVTAVLRGLAPDVIPGRSFTHSSRSYRLIRKT